MGDALKILEAEVQRVLDAAPRSDFVRIPLHIAAACRSGLYAADALAALQARLAAVEAERDEMKRRRDEWRKKAEGFDTIRHALREKVGAPWPPSLSRALWAALAADEKKRADDAEAERVRLSEALTVIAERPGTGTDRWGNGLSENEHMAEIAKDTLEGNEHFTVGYFKENRWEQPHG